MLASRGLRAPLVHDAASITGPRALFPIIRLFLLRLRGGLVLPPASDGFWARSGTSCIKRDRRRHGYSDSLKEPRKIYPVRFMGSAGGT